MIVCAGESEQFTFAQPIGIGLISSAIRLTQLCQQEKPDEIIFVGTAGSYGTKEIFSIVESYEATQIEQTLFTNNAYSPLTLSLSTVSRETTEGVVVNSSNYITTNKEVWRDYVQRGIEIENMEFFSVMQVGLAYNIPVRGIFIVTNYCDENAHRDFMQNHKEAMERLTAYVTEQIDK